MRREFFLMTQIETADGPLDASVSGFCTLCLDLSYGADADGNRGQAVYYVANILAREIMKFDEDDGLPRRVECGEIKNWDAVQREIANSVLEQAWQDSAFAGL